jgi:hypothetical protein
MNRLRSFMRRRPRLAAGAAAGAVLASAALAAHATGLTGRAWERFRAWRANEFTQQGYTAWQAGSIREAELAFISAMEMNPRQLRPRLLQGRMLLQQQRREEGRRLFLSLLEQPEGTDRTAVASLYLDALLATSWYEELARFARAEWARVPRSQQDDWATAALHGVRLGRMQPAPDAASAPPAGLAAVDALIGARLYLNAGNREAALRWFGAARGRELAGSLRFAAMSLAVDLGAPASARHLLLSANGPLGPVDLALGELWLGTRQGDLSAGQRGQLLARAFPPGQGQLELLASLACLLDLELPGLPTFLANRFLPEESRLADATVAALWLAAELNSPAGAANAWSSALQRRLGVSPATLAAGDITAGRYSSLINTLPLARNTVIALLGRVRPAAD